MDIKHKIMNTYIIPMSFEASLALALECTSAFASVYYVVYYIFNIETNLLIKYDYT